jgi:recyclin-1
LCKHIKRQRISTSGAIRLISDFNLYYSYIITLKIKSLTPYFAALRELGSVFLIEGKDGGAKDIARVIADHERFSGVWRVEEVYEFVSRRADWFEIKREVEKQMYGFGCVIC